MFFIIDAGSEKQVGRRAVVGCASAECDRPQAGDDQGSSGTKHPAAELSSRRIERGDFAAAEIPNEYVFAELSEACRGLGHTPRRVEPRAVLETKQEIAGTIEFIDVAQPASLL